MFIFSERIISFLGVQYYQLDQFDNNINNNTTTYIINDFYIICCILGTDIKIFLCFEFN